MIIKFSTELFSDPQNFEELKATLTIASFGGRYEVFVEWNELKNTSLFNYLTPLEKEVLERSFNKIVIENSKFDYVVSSVSTAYEFSIKELIVLINQPHYIIVENSLNDGYFIDSIIQCFRSKSKRIRKFRENSWLNYYNAGGCGNIINCLKTLERNFTGFNKSSLKYLKCIVIMDSDFSYPNQKLDQERIQISKYLDDYNIPHHILFKREMENYLPDEVIESIEDIDDYFTEYSKLSPIQKDYFDIQNGFKRNLDKYSDEIRELYADLTPEQISVFRKGSVLEVYKKDNFKSEFPKLFLSEKVSQVNLLRRTNHQENSNELTEILEKITSIL